MPPPIPPGGMPGPFLGGDNVVYPEDQLRCFARGFHCLRLDLQGLEIPALSMSPVVHSKTITPMVSFPLSWSLLSFTRVSIASIPALSANVLGIISMESANASIASCSRPPTLPEYLRICLASRSPLLLRLRLPSRLPVLRQLRPAHRSWLFRLRPRRALFRLLSVWKPLSGSCIRARTSSRFLRSLLLRLLLRIRGLLRTGLLGWSTTVAPVALASLSMSDFLTLRAANIPAFAR